MELYIINFPNMEPDIQGNYLKNSQGFIVIISLNVKIEQDDRLANEVVND